MEALHSLMHLYRALRTRTVREGGHELAHMEARALGFFVRHPGATQSDLVAHSGRDKGQVARLISALKDRGLLEARQDETDRRTVRLHATDAAKAIHQAMHRHGRKLAAQATADLSAGERAQLLGFVEKIRARLEESA